MFGDQFRTVLSPDTNRHAGMLDLQLTAVLTVLAAVVLAVPVDEPTLLRAVVGLPLLLFLPGYALAAALFPAGTDNTPQQVGPIWHSDARAISVVERIVIAFVASVAIVGAAGVVANAVVGVRLLPILLILAVFTLLASIVAYAQRMRLPDSRRYAPLQSLTGASGPTLPATITGWALVLAAALALVVVGASGVAAMGADSGGVTEFYVGGPTENGTIAMGAQPTNLTADDTATHYLVVEQRSSATENYTVVAQLTDGANGTGAAREIGRYQVTINGTGHAVQPVELSVDTAGEDLRVEYYLYEGTAPETPSAESALRSLGVGLNVTEG